MRAAWTSDAYVFLAAKGARLACGCALRCVAYCPHKAIRFRTPEAYRRLNRFISKRLCLPESRKRYHHPAIQAVDLMLERRYVEGRRISMDCIVRNARMQDYESAMRIMSQVQQMHVNWRPDLYKPNPAMIPREEFANIVEGDTFFVAEADGRVVGVMGLVFRHIETPCHVTRDIILIDSMAVDETSLFTIFVLPEYQRKGIGRKIIETLEQDAYFLRAKRIEIPASITGTPFYPKMGYDDKNGVCVPDEEGLLRLEKHR